MNPHHVEHAAARVIAPLERDHFLRARARAIENTIERAEPATQVLRRSPFDGTCTLLREFRTIAGAERAAHLVVISGSIHGTSPVRGVESRQLDGLVTALCPDADTALVRLRARDHVDLIAAALVPQVMDALDTWIRRCIEHAAAGEEAAWILAALISRSDRISLDHLAAWSGCDEHMLAHARERLCACGVLDLDTPFLTALAPIIGERLSIHGAADLRHEVRSIERGIVDAIRDAPYDVSRAADRLERTLAICTDVDPGVALDVCDELVQDAGALDADALDALLVGVRRLVARLSIQDRERADRIGRRLSRWHVDNGEDEWFRSSPLSWQRLVRRARSGSKADVDYLTLMVGRAGGREHQCGWQQLASGVAANLASDWTTAQAHLEHARRLARSTQDHDLELEVCLSIASSGSWRSTDAWNSQLALMERTRRHGTPADLARIAATALDVSYEHGTLETWRSMHEAAVIATQDDARVDAAGTALLQAARSYHAVIVGDESTGPTDATTMLLDREAKLSGIDAALAAILMAATSIEQGHSAATRDYIEAARWWSSRSSFQSFLLEVDLLHARSLEIDGRHDDAIELLERIEPPYDEPMTVARWAVQIARTCMDIESVDHRDRVVALHDEVRAMTERSPYIDCVIVELAHWAGTSGNHGDHGDVARMWRALGSELDAVRYESIDARRRQDITGADLTLDRARRSGYGVVSDQLSSWLRAHGRHRAKVTNSSTAAALASHDEQDSLTDRQRTVLDLRGAGMSNVQIAKRLGVSDRYVRRLLAEARDRQGHETKGIA